MSLLSSAALYRSVSSVLIASVWILRPSSIKFSRFSAFTSSVKGTANISGKKISAFFIAFSFPKVLYMVNTERFMESSVPHSFLISRCSTGVATTSAFNFVVFSLITTSIIAVVGCTVGFTVAIGNVSCTGIVGLATTSTTPVVSFDWINSIEALIISRAFSCFLISSAHLPMFAGMFSIFAACNFACAK